MSFQTRLPDIFELLGAEAHGDVAAALLFCVLLLHSLIQMLQHRSWFLLPFSLALGIEAAGLAALSYLSIHVTSHVAYVVSFAALTLGPSLLVLAALGAFGRLIDNTQHLEANRSRLFLVARAWVACLVAFMQVMAMFHFVYGIFDIVTLHSLSPIVSREDALVRVMAEMNATSMLSTGYITQLISLGLFLIVAHVSLPVEISNMNQKWGNVRWALHAVIAFSLIRTSFKISAIGAANPHALELFGEGTSFWLMDILPLIFASTSFTMYYSDIAIPEPCFYEQEWHSDLEKIHHPLSR